MCLTEPHAGTDLGLLKLKLNATKMVRYNITGTKIFITGGDHDLAENIIHLVLAKHLMHLQVHGYFFIHRAEILGKCRWFFR